MAVENSSLEVEEKLNAKYGIVQLPAYSSEDFEALRKTIGNKINKSPNWDSKWNSDDLLKRFLRTFGTVKDTTEKLIQYFDWRFDEKVDQINPSDPAIKKILSGHSNIVLDGVYDRCGRPIMLIRAKNHRTDEKAEDIWKSAVYYLEKVCKQSDDTQLKDFCMVYDLNGFTSANMDFPLAQKYFKALKNYYPERVGVALIINYPFIIHSVWHVVKLWLNQRLRSKFIFCGEKEFNDFVEVDKFPLQLF